MDEDAPKLRKSRTTPQLVETAIRGAHGAGMPVFAVDVHGGGFVRLHLTVPHVADNLKGAETKCIEIDDIFEVGCV
jgi:hypothetical protein